MKFINKNIKNDKIIFNSVNDKMEIDISTEIGVSIFNPNGYTFENFKNDVSKVESDEVTINIKSYGGDLFEALAIYDYIKTLDKKVITKIIGSSASAATVISLAGDIRLISKNSKYLIHKPMVGIKGNSDDFEKSLTELKKLDTDLIELYVENSNLNSNEIIELMKKEEFINAKKAIEYGFIDGYVKNNKIKIQNDMDKKILNLAGVKNEAELLEKIENSNIVNKITNQEDYDEETGSTENKEVKEEKVEDKEDKETPENPEPGQSEEEFIKELEEKNEMLTEKVEELQEKLKEYEVEEAENRANEVINFVNNLIDDNVIVNEAKEDWLEIGHSQGIEKLKTITNSISAKPKNVDTKLSDKIKPNVNNTLKKEDVLNKWKKGEISTSEYLNLMK